MPDNIFRRMGSTISTKIDAVQTALQASITAITNSKGVANGIATLDSNIKVPITQIPSDDVLGSLSSSHVTSALGFTPASPASVTAITNSKGVANGIAALDSNVKVPIAQIPSSDVLSSLTSGNVTTALGFTPASVNAPYDIYCSIFDKPTASEVNTRFVVARAFTIPSNCAGAVAKASVAATGSTVFSIQKNGTQVATVTFAAAGTVATFSTQAAISFIIGDKFQIVAPATPDATLSDIDFSILATLS